MTQDPFTYSSLMTIGGGALAATVVPNVLGLIVALPRPARAGIALAVGLAIQLVAATQVTAKESPEIWIVAILNGFLVAATALGINQVGTAGGGGDDGGGGALAAPDDGDDRRFFTHWL